MTTTDVAVVGETQVDDLSELQVWARDLGTAYNAAVSLVKTSFVPDSYRGKPEEAAAAIMTGQELGLSPLAALRAIHIINGTPAMAAIALRALVQSHGHEIWVEESTSTRAVVKGRRKGSDNVETSVWTIERATQLGLQGKDNWRKQPISMLLARATSEMARLIAADVLLGIPYSIEELQDLDAGLLSGEPAAKKSSRRTVQRAPLDPTRGAPPAPDGVDESPAVAASGRGAEKAGEAVEEPARDEADDAARMAEIAREAEEEEARLADEENARAKAAAAAAFESAPTSLEEPPVDWEGPR